MRRVLLIGLLPVLALTACTPSAGSATTTATAVAAPAPSASAVARASSPPSAPAPPSAAMTPSAAPSPAHAGGCPPTAAQIPSGAVTAVTGDVDGDGRADVEWAIDEGGAIRFGVRTASGATASASYSFAGPIARTVVVARLAGGAVIALPSDHRGAQLFAFAGCRFLRPLGVDGKPYAFDQEDLRGNGTGVGCFAGRLYGLQISGPSGSRTVSGTLVTVSRDGRRAVNGATETIASQMGDQADVVRLAAEATCSPAPLLRPRPPA